jgi:hypothetical protein
LVCISADTKSDRTAKPTIFWFRNLLKVRIQIISALGGLKAVFNFLFCSKYATYHTHKITRQVIVLNLIKMVRLFLEGETTIQNNPLWKLGITNLNSIKRWNKIRGCSKILGIMSMEFLSLEKKMYNECLIFVKFS